MKMTQCDKCGAQKSDCSGLKWGVVAKRKTPGDYTDIYDFCPKCDKELKEFLGCCGTRIKDYRDISVKSATEAEEREKAEAAVKEALGIN